MEKIGLRESLYNSCPKRATKPDFRDIDLLAEMRLSPPGADFRYMAHGLGGGRWGPTAGLQAGARSFGCGLSGNNAKEVIIQI